MSPVLRGLSELFLVVENVAQVRLLFERDISLNPKHFIYLFDWLPYRTSMVDVISLTIVEMLANCPPGSNWVPGCNPGKL